MFRGTCNFRLLKRGVSRLGAGLRGAENFRPYKRGVSRLGIGLRGAGDEVPCISKFLAAAGGESKIFEVMYENTGQ